MRDGGRPDARFVGERGTLETLNQHPHHASVHGVAVECAGQDFPKGRGDLRQVSKNHRQRPKDVDAHHQGNHLVRHLGDALDAPQNDGRHNYSHGHTEHPSVAVKHRGLSPGHGNELARGLVDLDHVASAERTSNARHGKQRRQHGPQPFLVLLGKAVSEVVHGASRHASVRIHLTVFGAQGALHKLGAHSQKSGDNHPEGCAWAAQRNGHGHPSNVAHAHSARKGGGQRLKVTDLTLVVGVVKLAAHHVQRMAKRREVDEAVVHREDGRACQEPNQHERHFHATTHRDREEDHFHDRIGDRLHDRIDGIVDGRLCVRPQWEQRQQKRRQSFHDLKR